MREENGESSSGGGRPRRASVDEGEVAAIVDFDASVPQYCNCGFSRIERERESSVWRVFQAREEF